MVRFAAAFPLPQGQPGKAHEQRCIAWSVQFAEQVAHDFPNEGYGVKKATAGRPISKDSLAQTTILGLVSWDLMVGAGTGKPTLATNPKFHGIPTQVFVPVTATNHLGAAPEPVPEPPAPIPPTPPTPAPCKPAHPYGEHTPLGKALGDAFAEGYGATMFDTRALGEILAHLLWRYQFEGVSSIAVMDDAYARGQAARG
ncbi:MAG: hypothetical protein M3Q55_02625 [Acidobacteriota bacterium]|nr:hypothetical protein [Acidobacteriota bacterium]